MKKQLGCGWITFVVACCVSAACFPSEEAREEFCRNADLARQQEICLVGPGDDEGARPDEATDGGIDGGIDEGIDGGIDESIDGGIDEGIDGGPLPPECAISSDCRALPGPCFGPGTCVYGRCTYRIEPDGTHCSGTPSVQCRYDTGTCKGGACEYTIRTSGPCSDGNICTDESCSSSGQCVSIERVCMNTDNPCLEQRGICSTSTGECVFAPMPRGTACNDSHACTQENACDGEGACEGSPLNCDNPPECRQWSGTCSNNSCNWNLKPAGSQCNDNEGCTQGEQCSSSGDCTGGTRINCSNPPPCHVWAGTCSNGNCNWALAPSGEACSDGNACTADDSCNSSGVCVSGDPVICPDRQRDCLELVGETCNRTAGCVYRNTCNPGTFCNGFGICCPRQRELTSATPPSCPLPQ